MSTSSALHILCIAALATASTLSAKSAEPTRPIDDLPTADAATQSATAAGRKEQVSDEILVGFQPGAVAAHKESVRGSIGAEKIKEFTPINVQHWKLPPGLTVVQAIEILSKNPNVRFAEPNYVVRANQVTVPNDNLRGDLWAMHNVGQNGATPDADIDALEAWQLPEGSGNVVVGVIDTGIDWSHPDLVGKSWVNPGEIVDGVDNDGNEYIDDVHGWDFVSNDNDPTDDNSHGTHVSGTIAGSGNNGLGVIGVAGLSTKVKLLALKFLNAYGEGNTAGAISAVLYAATLKDTDGSPAVRITNNSWGGGENSEALKAAIAQAQALFVAAAGNDGTSALHYPSGYDLGNVLAVAATNSLERLAWFSNYGSWVHIGAPGESILSTIPASAYARYDGTSMATPHVAGAAALVLSQNPGFSPEDVKLRLQESGDSVAALAGKTATGKRLNVANALGAPALSQETTPPDPVTGFVADQATQTSARLQWLSPTNASAAYLYEVRYRTDAALTDQNWDSATPVEGEPAPQASGLVGVEVSDLSPATTYHFGIKVLNRSGLPSLNNPGASIQTANLGWKPTLVDTAGDPLEFRSFVSMAFSGNNPVLAYSDYANSRMKLATWNGSAWSYETVGSDYGAVSLALDPTGKPTFSWSNGGYLYFSAKASTKWSSTAVERGRVDRYTPTSHAYGPSGPAISYRVANTTSDALKLAWRVGSTWKTQVIDTVATGAYYSGGRSSLAIRNGQATIAFTDDESDDYSADCLKLAQSAGTDWTQWTITTVEDSIPAYSYDCSLAFDAQGRPVIADVVNGNIRLLRKTDAEWSEQVIGAGYSANLVINGPKAWIAFGSDGRAKVASAELPIDPNTPATWTVQVAEIESTGGEAPSIKLQPGTQTPHLSYFVGKDLHLTKQDPTYSGPSFAFPLDDMGNPASGWVAEGNINDPTPKTKPPGAANGTGLWHRTSRRGTDPGHSPMVSWYYGNEENQYAEGTYDTGTRNWGRLRSPVITLPAGSRAELSVSQLVLAEGSRYENGEVQIRVEGSSSWTTIFQRASRTNASFITDKIDLTSYLGKNVEIGFFFDTKDGGFNQFEGWYVDDVSVRWWP